MAMKWVQRIIGRKPRRETVDRDYSPSAEQSKRYFKAAESSRLLTNWENVPVSIDQVLRTHLRSLRARSREQGRNNDYAKRYIALAQSNIVGSEGIRVRPKILTQSGTLDAMANTTLSTAWTEWGEDSADVSGQLSFLDIQRLFVASCVTDGEFVAMARYTPSAVYLEVVDPELIDERQDGRVLRNGNVLRLGIEYEGARPVAMWLRGYDTFGNYSYTNPARVPFYTANGMPQVFHHFVPEWPNQPRGIPWLSTALYRMKMLDGYEDAAVIAARFGANKLGVITTKTGDEYAGETDSDGRVFMDAEPGSFEQLPEGATLTPFDPGYPHDQYPDFMKRTLMGLNSGLPGSNYNLLASDGEGVSYSTMRQFAIEDRELWKCYQKVLIRFVRRFRNGAWLPIAKLNNVLDNRRTIEACKPASFEGRRWDWVDPEKEMNANQKALESMLDSPQQIIRNRGGDPEQVLQETKEWQEKKAAMEIDTEERKRKR